MPSSGILMEQALPQPLDRVLAIYAHPDDAEVSCGGSLALWSAMGTEVSLIVCTSGEKGTSSSEVDPKKLTELRLQEMTDAAGILGLTSIQSLGAPDGEVENTVELRERLVFLIRQFKPQVVVAPDPTAIFFGGRYYNHRDHRELGWAVLDSIFPASRMPHYFPNSGEPHAVDLVLLSGTLYADYQVDITTTVEAKVKAVGLHKSQLEYGGDYVGEAIRSRAFQTGKVANMSYAEAFRTIKGGN